MRKKILIANWKLNSDYFSIKKFVSKISLIEEVDVYVAPSCLGLLPTLNVVGNKNIKVCAQNVNSAILGDHTGSLSWMELKDYGIETSIVAHPEAMKDFSETHLAINTKVRNMAENNFKVFLCVTESRIDLQRESSKEALKMQIKNYLKHIDPLKFVNNLVIVYKPIFNQELSQNASSAFVIDTIKIIRNFLREEYGFYVGNNIPLLYGGESLADDIYRIIENNHVDGLMLDDHKAISAKYSTLILKAMYKASTENYINFYDQNPLVEEATEIDRERVKEQISQFDEYEVDNDFFFKEVDLFEEEV